MKIDRISYQKIFPTGMAYLNHKIGVEVQVSEGDNVEEAFNLAKKTVDRWNIESNPGMAATMEYVGNGVAYAEVLAERHKEPKEKRLSLLASDIESCVELKVLESYKLIVKQAPELQDVYDKKFKELSKK